MLLENGYEFAYRTFAALGRRRLPKPIPPVVDVKRDTETVWRKPLAACAGRAQEKRPIPRQNRFRCLRSARQAGGFGDPS